MSIQIIEAQTALTKKRQRLAKVQREVANAERKLEAARASLLPTKEGTIVEFALSFVGSFKSYRYAAVLVGGRWFTTGSTCPTRGYSPRELVELVRSAHVHTDIRVLSGSLSRSIEVV